MNKVLLFNSTVLKQCCISSAVSLETISHVLKKYDATRYNNDWTITMNNKKLTGYVRNTDFSTMQDYNTVLDILDNGRIDDVLVLIRPILFKSDRSVLFNKLYNGFVMNKVCYPYGIEPLINQYFRLSA